MSYGLASTNDTCDITLIMDSHNVFISSEIVYLEIVHTVCEIHNLKILLIFVRIFRISNVYVSSITMAEILFLTDSKRKKWLLVTKLPTQ